MFLIYFLVFILIFTLFENGTIAIILLVASMIFLVIIQVISHKKFLGKYALLVLVAFILAGTAFGVKERRYYGDIRGKGQGIRDQSSVTVSSSAIISTGMIVDIQREGKYVIEVQGNDYLLASEKEYSI